MARVIPPTSRRCGAASGAHGSLGKREKFGAIMKCGSWWQLMAYGKERHVPIFDSLIGGKTILLVLLGKTCEFCKLSGGFSKSNSDAQLSC